MEKSDWANDWNTFVDELSRRVTAGAGTEQLSTLFAGTKVRWTGTLKDKKIDELSASVNLAFPKREIEIAAGQIFILEGLSVPVASNAIEEWLGTEIGSTVVFDAEFGKGAIPFPPIEIKVLSSGKALIFVRLSEGRLVECSQPNN